MNIALIGYGKMGKVIEEIAISRGHTILAISNSQHPIENIDFENVDVAIEFSIPDLAPKHIKHCVDQNTPIVVGTTAWNGSLPEIKRYVENNEGSLLYASNFSIGVNIFFELNKQLSSILSTHSGYKPSLTEIHHTEKLDAPSGTAVSLANDIVARNKNIQKWTPIEKEASVSENELGVISERIEGVPGTHTIKYDSSIDTIEISHIAHNRNGFALGSVLAAEFLANKKGIFTMQDVIKL